MRRSAYPEEKTLDLIYDAAVDPSLWIEVMNQLMAMIGGEGGVLLRTNIVDGKGAALLANGDNSTIDRYFSYYSNINPLARVPDPSSYISGWRPRLLLDEDWIPRENLERSEYYNDFLRPLSSEWGLIIRLGLRGLDLSTISIGRSFGRGRFESFEMAAMKRFHPHLIRAHTLSERLAALGGLNTGLTHALDHCSSAMFLLDADARILHANAAAEHLLTGADVLVAGGGRLCAADADSTSSLAALIARAGTNDWEQRSAGSLSLPVRARRLPLTVTATPLSLPQVSVFARSSAVLVCVNDPRARPEAADARLAERFALTSAESRLALALNEGLTLREASARHSISVNTARAQLSSIFAKTGTHRQAELVRLMTSDRARGAGASLSP